MKAIDALLSRRSYARGNLMQPAPDQEQLSIILQAAMSVPDHGKLTPWRFVVVRGQGITDLSLLVKQHYSEADMNKAQLTAFVKEIAETPMMVFVCSNLTTDHRIPILEQQLSGGAACEHILLAAHAMGFAGIWHSLEVDDGLRRLLAMGQEDTILGVLSLGTPKRTSHSKRKRFKDYTSEWNQQQGLTPWS